jgi:hypothetical protein
MSLGRARTPALWALAIALMMYGAIADHEDVVRFGLLVGLMAVTSSFAHAAHNSALLVSHVLALFQHDVPIDTPLGRQADSIMNASRGGESADESAEESA